jgi:outer membrane immunogenic protein
MRKLGVILFAAATVSPAQTASAADLGTAPIYRKAAPVPAPAFNWAGSYIGGFVGGAVSANSVTTTDPLAISPPASYDLDAGVIAGYTGGYNLQVAPQWLIGYEGETGYIGVKGSGNYLGSAAFAKTETNGMYSAWTGRLGYIVAERSLFYVKGGAALARFNTSYNNGAASVSGHEFVLGYAAGAGWEYAIDPKWSVKAEYLYLGFDKTFDFGPTGTAATTVNGIHTGKVGLNYKWDWSSLLR